MEGAADGHITVKGHGQQDGRFHKGESMEEEELCKAGLKSDFLNVEPEELHDCGQSGECEAQVSQSQHGEEQVHGLAQRRLYADDSKNGSVSHDGDPYVRSFKSRNAREDEVEGSVGGVSHRPHF